MKWKLNLNKNICTYLSVPISQGYKSITRLSTQEQLARHRFSLESPTIQSGLGIIFKKIYNYFFSLKTSIKNNFLYLRYHRQQMFLWINSKYSKSLSNHIGSLLKTMGLDDGSNKRTRSSHITLNSPG